MAAGCRNTPVVKCTNRTKTLTVGGKVLVHFTDQGIQNQGMKCTTTPLSSLSSDQKCCYGEIAAPHEGDCLSGVLVLFGRPASC